MLNLRTCLAHLLLATVLGTANAQSAAPAPRPAAPLADSITYSNAQYGFRVLLPRTWTGYTIVSRGTWEGTPVLEGAPRDGPAKGPLLRIRHPRWTKARPYEDIPIMIFTRGQWARVENETLITGAAPFPPSELARNARYVFALPPRYNFDYATGWEEVEKIIDTRPVHPTS